MGRGVHVRLQRVHCRRRGPNRRIRAAQQGDFACFVFIHANYPGLRTIRRGKEWLFPENVQQNFFTQPQFVTLKRGQNIKYRPFAFTEHGILMLSSVLNSERAVQVNIEIMRAFVWLREMIASHKDLAKRLDELEKKYDVQFRSVFDAIRQLMAPIAPPRRRIGFRQEEHS
ncbi:MAG: ORF6N domain-containing protein [Nitrospiraceae bacterium]|nr:MAG: ORF6N domain-containing protein [Nitrospiraceae bacterium]